MDSRAFFHYNEYLLIPANLQNHYSKENPIISKVFYQNPRTHVALNHTYSRKGFLFCS